MKMRILVSLLAALTTTCFAQLLDIPTVSVRASDAFASRSGDPGEFTLIRDGNTTSELHVFYLLQGTAQNGVDYVKLSNWAVIPSGARAAAIKVQPLPVPGSPAVETVVLHLDYSPMMPPVNYDLGQPRDAVVFITNAEGTNLPPVVRIAAPLDGTALPGPTNVTIIAEARDLDTNGFVDTVEFFANGLSLGVKTNNPLSASPVNPFILEWKEAQPGDYKLVALATDNDGAKSTSEPVRLTIRPRPDPFTIVNVVASQPKAVEPCADAPAVNGRFTFSCNKTNLELPVFFVVRGTALPGVDYQAVTNLVVIPKGSSSVDLEIVPLADLLAERVESVEVQVMPPVCITIFPPPPECYLVGPQSQAAVFIADCGGAVTNLPPVVKMVGPPNGAVFFGSLDLPLFAFAQDRDGSVVQVEFFANDKSLGLGLPATPPTRFIGTNLCTLIWSNAPVGKWSLTAKATDDKGAAAVSEPVGISILEVPPPATNRPNVVSIIATDPIAIEGTNCWPSLAVGVGPSCWTNWIDHPVRIITNCGPKNAMFTVRRRGATNEPVTVNYRIGGTAIGGVDYVALPGNVTIPAGDRHAVIPVVPLDSGLPHTNCTVVLKVEPAASYIVGFPGRAAVLIVDSDSPRWFTRMLPGGTFHLNASGPDGAWFRVERSLDLVDWTGIATNQVVNGSVDFIDADSATQQGYYRAVPEMQQPLE